MPVSLLGQGGRCWGILRTLTKRQGLALAAIKQRGGALWRAYEMKESLRAIFAGDLEIDEVNEMLDHWCKRASRSRLSSFIRLSKTIRTHRDSILASIRLGVSNGRVEGLKRMSSLHHCPLLWVSLRQGYPGPGDASFSDRLT